MDSAIFWDFDGTLVKSNHSFLEALESALGDQGLSMDRNRLSEFLKSSCSWYFPGNLYEDRVGEAWWEDLLSKLQTFCEENGLPEIPAVLSGFRRKVISFPYELYDDAEAALQACSRAGFRNYILSNNFPELRTVIKNMGLSPYFTDIFLSSELGAEKPNPLIFRKALHLAGNPGTPIMVGDNPIADIQGARAAGMTTVLLRHPGEADFVIQNLRELPALFCKD